MNTGRRAYVRAAAGTGVLLSVLGYQVVRHHTQVTWTIGPPVPVAWIAVAEAAYLLAMPLLFTVAGLRSRPVLRRPWPRMLLRWTVPLAAAYLLALVAANALMWRFNAAFGASRARDAGELLEQALVRPGDAWFLYALAIFPVAARLTRSTPAVVLLPAAAVAALGGIAAAGSAHQAEILPALFFFLVGARWPETVSWAARLPAGVRRAAVAAGSAAVLGCAGVAFLRPAAPPDRGLTFLLSVVALPAGLTLAAGLARRRPATTARFRYGSLAVYLALVPVTVLADRLLLARLSETGPAAQMLAAVAGPVALTALVVLAGLCGAPVLRRILSRITPRGGAGPSRSGGPVRRVAVAGSALLLLGPAAPAAPPPAAEPEIILAFAGDVHFQGRVAALLADPGTALRPASRTLSGADLALLNLETAVTGRGTPEPKRYLFRAPPAAIRALTAAGVDAVSLANNHSMDYGTQGLLDTVDAARRGRLGVFGAGRDDEEAYRPWRRTVRGQRIAVFGFSQVDDLAERWTAGPGRPGMAMAFDVERAAAAVAAARAAGDLVIVMPHWGVEGDPCPDDRQRAFAARMARAGADVVVGAHSHVLQGAGYLDDTFVAYGLGNFLWYSGGPFPPYSSRTGVLVLRLRGHRVAGHSWEPAVVSGTGRPLPQTGWRADLSRRNFAALRGCARLAPEAPDQPCRAGQAGRPGLPGHGG